MKRRRALPGRWEWAGTALLAVFLLRSFLFFSAPVSSNSMEPLLTRGEWVVAISYRALFRAPEKGDIVLIKNSPRNYRFVKVITAIPADAAEGILPDTTESKVLLEGDYFVEGKQLKNSIDSNELGPVSYQQIMGKVFCVIWPLSSWRWLKNHA